jgi:glutamate dehydrogenase
MSVTLEHLKRRITAARGGSETLQTFAELLFDKADPDFMAAFDPDTLTAMAAASLRRVQQPFKDDLRVSVYNPSYAADGWEAPYTVVEAHLQDRPFIVDSLRAALKREGHAVYHILHPILEVVRDDKGAFGGLGGEAASR